LSRKARIVHPQPLNCPHAFRMLLAHPQGEGLQHSPAATAVVERANQLAFLGVVAMQLFTGICAQHCASGLRDQNLARLR
jgi:hypothetical protein